MKESIRPRAASFQIAITLAAPLLFPASCWAAPYVGASPWDYSLMALQDMLITYVAPAAIALSFTGAIILYALGGRDEEAGRLFGSASAAARARHRLPPELRLP